MPPQHGMKPSSLMEDDPHPSLPGLTTSRTRDPWNSCWAWRGLVMTLWVPIVLLTGCSDKELIPREQAVESVLEQLGRKRPPGAVTARLDKSYVPGRFKNTDHLWTVESRKGRWAGWVDAETGEVLDVIMEARSEGQV